ncbi:MAG: glycosyltransferase, partial [Kiritimatiellaeota bacterium]|nr:glycosyltransferase [Kiritimatiellota bacterium]
FKLHKRVKFADWVHVHSNWTFPVWWGCCLAHLHGKKLVMSPRGGLDPLRLAHSAWKKKTVGWVDRWCFRRATVIHATSVAESDWVARYLGEGAKSKIRIVPNGLSIPNDEQGKPQPPSSDNKRMILSLGRLHPLKGLDLLVEAWKLVSNSAHAKDWKLVIAGPDEQGMKNKLSELCEKLNLTNIEICDGVYGGEKLDLLRSADIFVLPSRSENFGNVVGEALACRTPVVMTDVGVWKAEAERCFGAGAPIHFVETSASGIADGLAKVMALDDATRTEMGRNGRTWISKEFQWERVAERMIEAYG